MSMTAIILLAIVVILVLCYVLIFNRFVALRNEVKNAFAQIDVQLKRRYDLIPNLVEVAKGYMQHEQQTLEAVIAARSQAVSAVQQVRSKPSDGAAMLALAGAEGVLEAGLGRLMALSEAYPDLKADQQMQRLSEEIASTENRIGFARQAYNDTVLAFNTATEVFPSNIVARLSNFPSLPMLESTRSEAERQAPQVRFGS